MNALFLAFLKTHMLAFTRKCFSEKNNVANRFFFQQTPLHLAVRDGSLEIAEILLSFGASPSARDRRGNSALHMAVAAGAADMTALLVAAAARGGGGGGGGQDGRGGGGGRRSGSVSSAGDLNVANDYGEFTLCEL